MAVDGTSSHRNIPVTQVTLVNNQGSLFVVDLFQLTKHTAVNIATEVVKVLREQPWWDQAKSKIKGIASDTAANQIAANRIIKEKLVSDGIDLRSYRCTMHLVRNRIRNKILLYLKNLTYVLTISSKIQVCTIKK